MEKVMNNAIPMPAPPTTLDELKQCAADNAAQAAELLSSVQALIADLRGEPRAGSTIESDNSPSSIIGQTHQLQAKTHSTMCEIDGALHAIRRELFSSSLDGARAA